MIRLVQKDSSYRGVKNCLAGRSQPGNQNKSGHLQSEPPSCLDSEMCVLNWFLKLPHKDNNPVEMIASVSTNLNSIIITVQSKVCYYFKQRGTIDTQGRSLSFLTGDAQGCSNTRKMLAASHFIKMMFLPFVLASTSLLQKPPSALTFSVILMAVQKAFLVQGLKYYSGCFLIFPLLFPGNWSLSPWSLWNVKHSLSTFSLCICAVIAMAALPLSCLWFVGRVDICYSSSCLLNPFLL